MIEVDLFDLVEALSRRDTEIVSLDDLYDAVEEINEHRDELSC